MNSENSKCCVMRCQKDWYRRDAVIRILLNEDPIRLRGSSERCTHMTRCFNRSMRACSGASDPAERGAVLSNVGRICGQATLKFRRRRIATPVGWSAKGSTWYASRGGVGIQECIRFTAPTDDPVRIESDARVDYVGKVPIVRAEYGEARTICRQKFP